MDRNLKAENINLYQMNKDLVDAIWQFGRPGRPSSKIHILEDRFSGKASLVIVQQSTLIVLLCLPWGTFCFIHYKFDRMK